MSVRVSRDLRDLLAALGRASDDWTREASPWIRPFLRIWILVLLCVLLVLALPFLPFLRRRIDATEQAYERLAAHVRRQWSESGPDAAVALLRDVYARLRAAPDGRLVVEPYGTLHVAWNSFELTNFLYDCEVTVGQWDRALAVAEDVIALMGEAHAGSWLLSKARCLAQLGRDGEAKALLLRHRDPADPSSAFNVMLDELRRR
jgi:hypothetical protein